MLEQLDLDALLLVIFNQELKGVDLILYTPQTWENAKQLLHFNAPIPTCLHFIVRKMLFKQMPSKCSSILHQKKF